MSPSPRPVTIEPRIEPMPPITTTANTTMMRSEPISGPTVKIGAASTPANAASATPKPYVSVIISGTLMPNACTRRGFSVPARKDDADEADDQRRENQRRPVAHLQAGNARPPGELRETQPGQKRAHHVLRAVREIDDVEHAENNGEPQAQHGVKRAVDQADQKLAVERLRRDAQHLKHE